MIVEHKISPNIFRFSIKSYGHLTLWKVYQWNFPIPTDKCCMAADENFICMGYVIWLHLYWHYQPLHWYYQEELLPHSFYTSFSRLSSNSLIEVRLKPVLLRKISSVISQHGWPFSYYWTCIGSKNELSGLFAFMFLWSKCWT